MRAARDTEAMKLLRSSSPKSELEIDAYVRVAFGGPTPQECNLSLATQVVSPQPPNELPHDYFCNYFCCSRNHLSTELP